ncbi:MAG: FlhC family transcriptional regulator [Methylococcales bacterium]|nr:FlhC family transcriptional regulator [Methylobacter sp.]MDZ4154973.1 FlhC family transcriptional regulator [Methylococcales bacterium]MDP2097493.1 FlhC family transcriptional regulator [Methylobacter sp.]MDP2426684.1 FlhC family transcriptional regulator [Methylobacter sp.]MDP3055351.1 FlhC family transcriptional regulator [Methylobacter sp.]
MVKESYLRLTAKETDILSLKRKLNLAKGILEKGGRTSVVRAVCQVSKDTAIQLYKEIYGQAPTSGMLPYDSDWIIKTPENCLHGSIYCNVLQTISKNNDNCSEREKIVEKENSILLTKGEIFLSSYMLYEQIINKARNKELTINRAWHISQQIAMSYISGRNCTRCNCFHMSISHYPDIYKLCPVCDSVCDAIGRQKWKGPNLNENKKNDATDIFSKYKFHSNK